MAATGYTSTTGDARKVDVAGDTMTGELTLPDSSPDQALNAASKGYVDAETATLVTGAASSTDNAVARFDGTTGLLIQNSTVTIGDDGSVTITGTVNVTGDLTLQGTGKAYRFRRSGSALDLDATGVDLLISNFSGTAFDGTQRSYFRLSADAQNVQVAGKVEFVEGLYGATRHVLDGTANTIGFHGATPIAKQTVSGATGGNAALESLVTALATLGLITDGTS
ncbi:hypothetical protein WKI71_36535 [Streptomyces sp. MS1.AVA.1]|uniref:Uncharacterized protein n=1 Tax=Streptomyces machairae TaxID=3134109 RepID=A0ABU8USJ9_9ACTN